MQSIMDFLLFCYEAGIINVHFAQSQQDAVIAGELKQVILHLLKFVCFPPYKVIQENLISG